MTAGPIPASASKPSTNSDRIRSARHGSVSTKSGRPRGVGLEELLVLGRAGLADPRRGVAAHDDRGRCVARSGRCVGADCPGLRRASSRAPAWHGWIARRAYGWIARTRLIGGGILIATGLVWIGQGTGLIKSSSFMTGDPFWAWLGVAAW